MEWLSQVSIDEDDKHLLFDHKWCISNRGYLITSVDGRTTYLHHLIIGSPIDGLVTDHINRDKLDNRRSNLRHVTPRENSRNTSWNRILTIDGESKCIAAWSDDSRCSVSQSVIWNRLDLGWSDYDAIMTPVKPISRFSPKEDSQLLQLRISNGYTWSKISDIMGRSIGSLRKRLIILEQKQASK